MTRSVLVTCGEQRAALSIVRSLGRAGYRVAVCAAGARSLAGASRHAADEFEAPDPVADPEGYTASVRALVDRLEPDLLIPVTEAALLALLPVADRLGGTIVPFPDVERFSAICDKARVFEEARTLGIRVPDEIVAGEPGAIDPSRVTFPAVVKPSRSVTGTGDRRERHAVRHVANPEELALTLASLPAGAYPVHIQRRIVGPGVGVFLLLWDGRTIASFAHRRIREKPPSGGVSVLRESIALDPELLDLSRRLLSRFDWQGVAMVEYKIERETGEAYLMEVNGRFWGSLELAVASGVDFPRLLAEAACGDDPPPTSTCRIGVRSRWLWGDIDHLIARLRHTDARLALPPGSPGRIRAIGAFIGAFVRGGLEVESLADPGPAFREARDWFAALGRGEER